MSKIFSTISEVLIYMTVALSSAQSVPSRESQETTNGPCPMMTSVHQNVIERRNRSLWKTRRTVLRAETRVNPSANPGTRLSCEPYDQLMKEVFPEPQIDTKTDSETLLKGIKDILVQIQHQNERVPNCSNSVKKFGRPKTKAHERLETERENQDPEDRKKYLIKKMICRDITHKVFDIQQDKDFILHNPPSPEIILGAHKGTHWPDPSKLLVDTWGQIHSEWNNQVIGILKERVKDEATLQGLPLCSEAYLLQLVEDRVTKLHVLWREAQPKQDETGNIESLTQLEDHLWKRKHRTGKKYERRVHIVEQTILYKEDHSDNDICEWEWLLDVLKKLTPSGMSSKESNDSNSLQTIYRVKIMPWRHNIDNELSIINGERRSEMAGFSPKGSLLVPQIHQGNLVSKRKPMTHLPRVFYDDEWYNLAASDIRERTLCVLWEQFEWLELMVGSQ
ncbi:hypothetical protein Clacol_009729 [Clathrus columnatus]|uniref:Uncharacterized protein n=1 Tax=Clathrus columnatus TaxID=1419009 RepID=A0AAV5ALC1_9AGAM|nr:hypothetical protein Clacol_009729 [Clathrus columnatus]